MFEEMNEIIEEFFTGIWVERAEGENVKEVVK